LKGAARWSGREPLPSGKTARHHEIPRPALAGRVEIGATTPKRQHNGKRQDLNGGRTRQRFDATPISSDTSLDLFLLQAVCISNNVSIAAASRATILPLLL
jgi:hypothetical protein